MEHLLDNTKLPSRRGDGPTHAQHELRVAGFSPHPLFQLQRQAGNLAVQELLRSGVIQPKLAISQLGDAQEREADRVADRIIRSHSGFPVGSSCSCAGGSESCERCEETGPRVQLFADGNQPGREIYGDEAGTLQAASAAMPRTEGRKAPDIVEDVTGGPGQPLDHSCRRFMETQFGHDFGNVRIHTGAQAAASAESLNALAYTAGQHIVFSPDSYAPATRSGRALLAHELTHVVQQLGSRNAPTATPSRVQRAEKFGTKVTEPAGTRSPFSTVSATFDGDIFEMVGDGKTIVKASGQSGHPNQVDPADATACKGLPDDSYLNNSRYVGIKDKGPIPEGTFTFRHSDMVTFSAMEDAKMALAQPGTYVDPSGLDLHGDWGAARTALTPVSITPPLFCGSTAARSGFYLHGGVMTGSSGCIDIGNSAISDVVQKLLGYTSPVRVTVKYTKPAPSVGTFGRAAGRFMYPSQKNPGFWDRVKSLFGG